MITVTLTLYNKISEHNFETITDALIFARSKEMGTSFKIKEGSVLLAKGKIEEYKETFDEYE